MKKDIVGNLIKGKVIIEKEFSKAQSLNNRSCFGEIKGGNSPRLELSLFEALYLLEDEKISIKKNNKKVSINSLINEAEKTQDDFYSKYCVFKDLRTRGYILKTALKFGADFRVYDKGVRPGKKHARWLLYCANENEKMTWKQFSAMNRVSHSTKKALLVGIVDSEGDVTYYEINWVRP